MESFQGIAFSFQPRGNILERLSLMYANTTIMIMRFHVKRKILEDREGKKSKTIGCIGRVEQDVILVVEEDGILVVGQCAILVVEILVVDMYMLQLGYVHRIAQ